MDSSSSALSSLILFTLLFTLSQANSILVGGKTDSWKIPSSEAESLNRWAEKSRFKVGDTLVLKFNPEKDSVLQVNKKDYKACNTSNPIAKFQNETTSIVLDRSGAHFFISGAHGHCEQGEKMIVVVVSGVHRLYKGVAPAPSPMVGGFEIAPTSGVYGLKSGESSASLLLGLLLLRMIWM